MTLGASLVLLPWGWSLVRRRGAGALAAPAVAQPPGVSSAPASCLLGLSPLPLRTTALLGLFGGPPYALLIYAGFFYSPATHAAVLMPGSLPLWTALLAAWLLRERIDARRGAGLALIVCGGLLVGGRSLLAVFSAAGAGSQIWKGDLLFLLAVWCWAGYGVLARRHAVDAVQATVAITAFAFLSCSWRCAPPASHETGGSFISASFPATRCCSRWARCTAAWRPRRGARLRSSCCSRACSRWFLRESATRA